MKLDVKEFSEITMLQKKIKDLVYEIGEQEVKKQRLLEQISSNEQRLSLTIQEIRKKYGISEGKSWTIRPDGEIIVE